MIRYLLKRLFLAVLTLFAILLVSYTLLRLAPGDPTKSSLLSSDASAGTGDSGKGLKSQNAALREKLHLDEPLAVGFCAWLCSIAKEGDFGESASVDPGRPVLEMIAEKLPVTLKLNLLAVLITYCGALFCGIYSSVHCGKWQDHSITFLLFLLSSLPAVWVGLLLQSLFCAGGIWPIFPLKGIGGVDPAGFSTFALMAKNAASYVLPVLCLSYAGFAGLSRYARSGMIEVLHSDFIRTARAKGVSEYDILTCHALRNTMITLITLFSGLLPGLIAGSVIVEYIFNIPGMGSLALAALSSRDYPLQMALFLFSGVLTLAGILLADLLYVLCDPRISLTGEARTR